MFVQAYSDDLKIIASGTFILKDDNANAKLHIDLKPEYNFAMDLVFTFPRERIEGDTTVKPKFLENNEGVELVIYNAENPFGNGTQKPTELAEFADGNKLLIHYFFRRPTQENPRIFTYSIFMKG